MKTSPRPQFLDRPLPTPREIYHFLDSYVIGQETAKRALAIAAYNHLKRSALPKAQKKLLRKSNLLMLGPTGCGKTHLAHKLAEFLNVPFFITDATEYTQAGYHGKDVETMVAELLLKAHHSIEEAQRGIVFIDEIDKIARRSQGSLTSSVSRDIGGEGVQQALLKILEGREIRVPLPSSTSTSWQKQESVQIDTTDVLFIAAGTFSELSPRHSISSIGFSKPFSLSHKFLPSAQDLIEFGMLAEFVGRLPILAILDPLTEEQLIDVLTLPPDALVREYQHLLALDEIHLDFTAGALLQLAKQACQQGTGARGLRALMEKICDEIMFEAPERPGHTFIMDEAYVSKRLAPPS